MPIFLKRLDEGHLSLEDAAEEKSNLATKLSNLNKGKRAIEKKLYENNLELLFSERENFANDLKSILFSIINKDKIPTREPTP